VKSSRPFADTYHSALVQLRTFSMQYTQICSEWSMNLLCKAIKKYIMQVGMRFGGRYPCRFNGNFRNGSDNVEFFLGGFPLIEKVPG
jgi:hypothetical protein